MRATRTRRWVTGHWPELALLTAGALLRVSMATSYDARLAFDSFTHLGYVDYLATRHALPPLDFSTTAYHPPLYYAFCALLVAAGFGPGGLAWLSALFAILRLVVVFIGLERWLPESRLARLTALATAVVIPAGLHLDGMVTNETLLVLLSALALLWAPSGIRAVREGRFGPVVRLALVLGLAVLTKVSAVAIVLAVLIALLVDARQEGHPWL